jgi:hypothetical protein
MRRTVITAIATIGVASALGHAIFPARDLASPAAQQRELQRQYSVERERELAQRRDGVPFPLGEDGEAVAAGASGDDLARRLEQSLVREAAP